MKFLICFMLISCAQFSPKDQREKIAKKVWIKNLDPSYLTGNLPIAQTSPILFKNKLYIGDDRGDFSCFREIDGRLLWKISHKESVTGRPMVYKRDILYTTEDGRLFSRDHLTGKLNFKVDLGSPADSQGLIHKDIGYIYLRNDQVVSFDARTGKVLWSYKRSHSYKTTMAQSSVPVVYKNMLILGTSDGYLMALTLFEGRSLWEEKLTTRSKFVDVDLGPYIWKGRIFASSVGGPFVEVSPTSGKILQSWSFELSHDPVFTENYITLGTFKGDLIRINSIGKVVYNEKFNEGPILAMTQWKDLLVVSQKRSLNFIDFKNLRLKKTIDLGHPYSRNYTPLAKNKKTLAFLTSRNRLFVFN